MTSGLFSPPKPRDDDEPPPLEPERWKYRPYSRSRWAVGLDLGQSFDPSALAIIERRQWYRVKWSQTCEHKPAEVEYRVRHLERLQLGVLYPVQAHYVRSLMGAREELAEAELVLDYTGVGRAVYDIFREQGLRPTGLTITSGEAATRDGLFWRVPKLALVSRLQALMHTGELHIAAELTEAEVLKNELQNFRVNFNATGYASFGARDGAHDDLVLAVAIATWWLAERSGQAAGAVPISGFW